MFGTNIVKGKDSFMRVRGVNCAVFERCNIDISEETFDEYVKGADVKECNFNFNDFQRFKLAEAIGQKECMVLGRLGNGRNMKTVIESEKWVPMVSIFTFIICILYIIYLVVLSFNEKKTVDSFSLSL